MSLSNLSSLRSSLSTDYEALSESPPGNDRPGSRWSVSTLALDAERPINGQICMLMWPTFALSSKDSGKDGRKERWFDDLHVWTEGFQPTTMLRARIQLNALTKAFALLEQERVHRVGVTLSFGTIERCLDLVTDLFDEHQLLAHRTVVTLRGQLERLRVPSRVLSFVDWLRAQNIPVGYRLSAQRINAEMRAIQFVDADFAKVASPNSTRQDVWDDMALEARVAGVEPKRLVIGGVDTLARRHLARTGGFGFAQGRAIRAPYDPPPVKQ